MKSFCTDGSVGYHRILLHNLVTIKTCKGTQFIFTLKTHISSIQNSNNDKDYFIRFWLLWIGHVTSKIAGQSDDEKIKTCTWQTERSWEMKI